MTTLHVLLGRVPIGTAWALAGLPKGVPKKQASQALDAAIAAEIERQTLAQNVAAAPLRSLDEEDAASPVGQADPPQHAQEDF